MRTHCKKASALLLAAMMAALLMLPSAALAADAPETAGDFTFTATNGKAKITGYSGDPKSVVVPNTIGSGDYPVTEVALSYCQPIIESIDVTNCASLEKLNVSGNALAVLDVSHNPALTQLLCGGNRIREFNPPKEQLVQSYALFPERGESGASNILWQYDGSIPISLDGLTVTRRADGLAFSFSQAKLAMMDISIYPDGLDSGYYLDSKPKVMQSGEQWPAEFADGEIDIFLPWSCTSYYNSNAQQQGGPQNGDALDSAFASGCKLMIRFVYDAYMLSFGDQVSHINEVFGTYTVDIPAWDGTEASVAPTMQSDYTVTTPGRGIPKYERGAGQDYELHITRNFSLYNTYRGVSIDGTPIPLDQYDVVPGSTVVRIRSAYLETLPLGDHTVDVPFGDGIVATHAMSIEQQSVSAAPDTDSGTDAAPAAGGGSEQPASTRATPTTGATVLWVVLVIAVAGAVFAICWHRRKRAQGR